MTWAVVFVSVGSAALGALLGWRLRPRPRARITATRVRTRWLRIVVIGAAAMISPLLAVAVGVGLAVWPSWSRARSRTQAARRTSRDFPDALDLLVLSIRAGYLPAQAISEITPFLPQSLHPSFTAVNRAMHNGRRFADALDELRSPLGPITQPLIDSLSAADRYGLPLAPVLERLSFEARQQRRRDADATARELPVRLAIPLVLCTLPSFVLLAIVPLLLGALSSLHT